MAVTTKVPLGADTFGRKWMLDVNDTGNGGTYAVPVWIGVFGFLDFGPALDPTEADNSDFDSAGYKSSVITALGWTLSGKVRRAVTTAAATAYDPGQEILRAAGALMGISNRVDVRWYEYTSGGPVAEAYRGYASVGWTDDSAAQDAISTVTISLKGQGARTSITHPANEAAAVPIVLTCTPSALATAGGDPVMLYGSHFTGTTAVKVGAGGTAFTDFNVLDDNHIVGVVPAKTTGSYVIQVTNATGASTTMPTVAYS